MTENHGNLVGRRAAIKTAAATGVAAVVWAEPTIKGLARRPAYADTGSTPLPPVMVTVGGVIAAGNPATITGITINGIAQPPGGTPIGNQAFLFESDVSNNGNRPRLLMSNPTPPNFRNGLINITNATSADPTRLEMPPVSGNQRRILFQRTAGNNPQTPSGTFTLTLTIVCG